jgi:acyl carrier protein
MNSTTNIEAELREFIARNILFAEQDYPLPDEASLLTQGVVDSTGVMELIEHVHQRFGFEVPLADITPENFDSISRLAGYIRRRLAEAQVSPVVQPPSDGPAPPSA